jgi:undecaprenyl-phosphate galactose phosphotransferase/putative colanic acid biosynthesis UDP-glucose lipid carrier transferase
LAPRLPRRLPFNLIEPAVLIADFIVVMAASLVGGIGYQFIFLDTTGSIQTYLGVGVLVFANLAALLSAQQNYRVTNLVNIARQIRYITLSWWFVCFVLLGAAFALKIGTELSRGSTLAFFIVGWASLVCFRAVTAWKLSLALEDGTFAEKKIILITERGGQATSRALADLRKCGYLACETIEITQSEIDEIGLSISLQEKLGRLICISRQEAIDHIFVLIKWSQPQFIENLVRLLRVVPIPVNLLPDENVSRLLATRPVNVGTAWTVELQRAPLTNIEQSFKRIFDLIGAAAAIVLFSPIMLIAALLTKLDSSGPILFTQRRNGFNEGAFFIYKFRTMHVLEDGDVIPQATRSDPRVTRVGRWLRQTSIDELPQLFNVIAGNMSLVGPRPHAVAHNNEYQNLVANYAFRHHVKPGITGWAQVNGYRGETQTTEVMANRVEYDLWYINHWSLWLDLKILLKTMTLVYRQPTAY